MSTSRFVLVAAMELQGCAVDGAEPEAGAPGGGKADDPTSATPFLSDMPGWGRYIVLDTLDEIVPAYLDETRAVLARIDALPAGTVTETTELDEVPIADLFEAGQSALAEVLVEADFTGGRADHDVAWLRQSAVELAALAEAVDQVIADGTSPASFDAHVVNTRSWEGSDGTVEISFSVAAVSRFYCNLDVRIVDDPTEGFFVEASETCD
ncbi:MAG TPA: hypothetical protein VM513_05390 [Kofleriaceae bacterium]|nr:hypothetical protein [Kofleriaceae bacterium]